MTSAVLWICQDEPVSWSIVGGNVRLKLGAAVVWMTPEQWEALAGKPPSMGPRLVEPPEDLTLTDLRSPPPLTLRPLRPVDARVRPLNPDVWPAPMSGEGPEAA
jgi:hypothetical protein